MTETTAPLTAEKIAENRTDSGEHISVGLPSVDECLQVFKMLGPTRTLEKVRQFFIKQKRQPPALSTLKKYSADHSFLLHADTYDRQVAAMAEEKAKEEAAIEAAGTIKSLAGTYRHTASLLISQIKKKIPTLKLGDGTQVRAAVEASVALSKAAEVMDGGVSDRTESRQTLTLEERRTKAQRMVDDAFKTGRFSGKQDNHEEPTMDNAADAGGSAGSVPGDSGVGGATAPGSGNRNTA